MSIRKVTRGALGLVTAAASLGLSFQVAQAEPLKGAIFTTTPDGGIVNENVRYESKLEVYLDGGPKQNAPQFAAGLPDDFYVFQITDPSGWVLLSDDPSKCRVVEVKDAIIIRLVPETELMLTEGYERGNGGNAVTLPCHVQDDPDGSAGPSGRHDTNTDQDYGDNGAIVVQMMPFLDTPNPGGVYKAWMTPLAKYIERGGNPEVDPYYGRTVKKKGQVLGYVNDPGFGPPRSVQKTDNFKVREQPPWIHVFKYHDINGNGTKDAGEPTIDGWEVSITETLFDGTTITNECVTPCSRKVAQNSTVTVTESDTYDGKTWEIGFVYIDGIKQSPEREVEVVFAPGDMKHTVEFGNFLKRPKSGIKCKDLKADGKCDTDDPRLDGWTINVSGTTGMGAAYSDSTTTANGGKYEFQLPPGSYTVSESCPPSWYQSLPKPSGGYTCGGGVYNFTILSTDKDDAHTGNDFGNFQAVKITARKFNDLDADGVMDPGEEWLEGVEFCLLQGGVKVDASDFLGTPDPACQKTDSSGTVEWDNLFPNTYTVDETVPAGAFPTKTLVEYGDGTKAEFTGPGADEIDLKFLVGCAKVGYASLLFGDGFKCVGLTPGYWSNWRNHYSSAEFNLLLAGTIAGSISEADSILTDNSCSGDDALNCMRKFLLANQLTINLTIAVADGMPLFNGDDAGLSDLCQVPGYYGTLSYWLGKAIALHTSCSNGCVKKERDYILQVKTMLDRFANLEIRP